MPVTKRQRSNVVAYHLEGHSTRKIAQLNRQNQRIIAASAKATGNARIVPKVQKAAGLMVFGAVSAEGKCPLIFLKEKINAQVYQDKILEPTIKHIRSKMFPNQRWTWQQDGAPPHTAKTSQDWLRNKKVDFVAKDQWPPYALLKMLVR